MLLSVAGKVLSRKLLNRMKGKVDPELRDKQAGFRKDRSCTDQIFTLRIILEPSADWNSSIYISLIDYEKTLTVWTEKSSGNYSGTMENP